MSELANIRLACMTCDREDFDGTTIEAAVQAGWEEVSQASILSESCWWTHLGYCLECRKEVEAEQIFRKLEKRREDRLDEIPGWGKVE